jgi:hypothetical protein
VVSGCGVRKPRRHRAGEQRLGLRGERTAGAGERRRVVVTVCDATQSGLRWTPDLYENEGAHGPLGSQCLGPGGYRG